MTTISEQVCKLRDESDDIDNMRKEFENPTEWRLRRHFLTTNSGKVENDRLECLSHCFINHEMYGASYPDQVMQEVRRLGEGIIDDVSNEKHKVKEAQRKKFVKESRNNDRYGNY